MAGALPHGGQHRDGDGQLQRAGEVHHQHRQRLGDVAGQQIGQRRAAQRIGHQTVGQTGGLVLGGGFQLFRLLNHVNDAVVPAAAGRLVHADNAFALLGHGSGIDIAAGPLGNRHGFAGHGGLIHHSLAGYHLAVQRDQATGTDDHAVARLDVGDGGQYLGIAHLKPYMIHVQAHGSGQIGHGFLVSPLLQYLAQPQHEHDRPGGGEVTPCDGHRHGGSIQHCHGQLAVPQRFQSLLDVLHRAENRQRRGDGHRQEQLGDAPPHDGHGQLVLKLPVQSAGGVLRHQIHSLGLGERESGQRGDDCAALRGIKHHGVLRPVIDLDLRYAGHIAQIVFQYVRLMQRHPGALHMHPQTPGGFMENCAFHGYSAVASSSEVSSTTAAASSSARCSLMALASE